MFYITIVFFFITQPSQVFSVVHNMNRNNKRITGETMRYVFKDGKYRQVIEDDLCELKQHNHEVLGTVQVAGTTDCPHTHRFANMSMEALRQGTDHVHEVKFMTDTYDDHYHQFCGLTGVSVATCDRHVHFLSGITTESAGHRHCFKVVTLIEDPTGI